MYESFSGSSADKESACNAGDLGLILGLGRSPGGGHGNPLQYSCLESPMNRGALGLQSVGSQRGRRDWASKHSTVHLCMSVLPGQSRVKGFSGSSVAKTVFPTQGTWVWPLVRELDPTKSLRAATKKIIKAGWKEKKKTRARTKMTPRWDLNNAHSDDIQSLLGLKLSLPDIHSKKEVNFVCSQHQKDKIKYPRDFLSCFWHQDQTGLFP